MNKKIGSRTIKFENPPSILSNAAIVGKKEGEGPLKNYFDFISNDNAFGQKTWEKAETKMQKDTLNKAIAKAGLDISSLDYIFAGDLLNQCIGSAYAGRDTDIPFFGLYGACSTMTESLTLAAMAIDGGFANYAAAVTSSHFCSAERQFRFPLEYGGQRTPTAQWTVTGSGAALLSTSAQPPYIIYSTPGQIVDLGINDINNMGAAMAPAACDTIYSFFKDTNTKPNDYDLILTGDLGKLGGELLKELLKLNNIEIDSIYNDCGRMIFDFEKQDVHAGGSGCGCMASVLCSYIIDTMRKKELNKILAVATGALMSPISLTQGETIPSIAHLVCISNTLQ